MIATRKSIDTMTGKRGHKKMNAMTMAMIEDLRNEFAGVEASLKEIIDILTRNNELLENIQDSLRGDDEI